MKKSVNKIYLANQNRKRLESKFNEDINKEWSKNKFILNWWNDSIDLYLDNLVDKYHWLWVSYIDFDYIVKLAGENKIEKWKEIDPLCAEYVWYNIIFGFCESRLFCRGVLNRIRKAEKKKCVLCGEDFLETSITAGRAKRMTINQIDFCEYCSDFMFGDTCRELTKIESKAIMNIYKNPDSIVISKLKIEVENYLRLLTQCINRIPMKTFGKSNCDFHRFSSSDRLKIYHLFSKRISHNNIEKLYGSWIGALVASNVLENGAIKTSRGVKCLANDGHVCNSIAEKTIDDFLSSNGIVHEKEPNYPEGNYRADFKIGSVMCEYFGLSGEESYDKKIQIKRDLCKKWGIELIEIFPQDLIKKSFLEKTFCKYTS